MSEPVWVPLGTPSIPQSIFPIDFRNPSAAINPGGAFPTVAPLTIWEEWAWHFVDNGLGVLDGIVRVPENAQIGASPRLIFELAAANAGNAQLNAQVKRVAVGGALNPGAFDISFTVTQALLSGRVRTTWTQPLSGAGIPAAGDLIIIRFYRDGAHASDTLSGDVELLGGYLAVG